MFDMSGFLKDNLVNGYWNGSFTKEQVNIFATNYLLKAIITQEDFNEILERISETEKTEEEDEEIAE